MPWYKPTQGSTDLFSNCSLGIVNVPQNTTGFQYAQSGYNYAGFILTSYDLTPFPIPEIAEYKEYISVKLTNPLIKGNKYCISMYLNLADKYVNAAIDRVGVYFSVNSFYQNNSSFINVTPQIEISQGFFTDTVNWVNISGDFIAGGGEEYITIGNFHSLPNTNYIIFDTTQLAGYAYYYLDNVSLICCDSAGCEKLPVVPNVFTPNNDGYNDVFELSVLPPSCKLTIYNRWGTVVFQSNNYQNNWDGGTCTDGVYYYIVNTANGKQYKGTLTIIR
jgi:gliding motility-associated-like protein